MSADRLLAQGGSPQSQGRLIGRRYRLMSPVGRGGMGMVWHAHDVLLDRDVAVKELILPFGLDHAGKQVAHRRMLREARSAARLTHPGIVTVHDVVEEDGRPWIVMELVRAWSLEQAVRQSGPLPVAQAAEIGIRVLDALRHAHAAGILHRDVKPGNVLLTADRVVLTDFGIAAIEGDVTITQTGLLMGSPAYIPPERLSGQPINQAADLWSFGATLYAAVEGRPPYEGSDAIAVLGAVLTQEPVRPQRAGALLPIIEGLLRKNPAERMSAAQAADLLERVLRAHGSQPPRSREPSPSPLPTPGDSTPMHMLPPLDPPSGPMPSRIVETPSGPVRVPYDPSGGPSGGYGRPFDADASPSGSHRTDLLPFDAAASPPGSFDATSSGSYRTDQIPPTAQAQPHDPRQPYGAAADPRQPFGAAPVDPRQPSGSAPSDAARQSFGSAPSDGARQSFGAAPSDGSRQAFDAGPSDGARQAFGTPPADPRQAFGTAFPGDPRQAFDAASPGGSHPGQPSPFDAFTSPSGPVRLPAEDHDVLSSPGHPSHDTSGGYPSRDPNPSGAHPGAGQQFILDTPSGPQPRMGGSPRNLADPPTQGNHPGSPSGPGHPSLPGDPSGFGSPSGPHIFGPPSGPHPLGPQSGPHALGPQSGAHSFGPQSGPQPILPLSTDSRSAGASSPWPLASPDDLREHSRDLSRELGTRDPGDGRRVTGAHTAPTEDRLTTSRRRPTDQGNGWLRDGRPTPRLIISGVAAVGVAVAAAFVLTSGGGSTPTAEHPAKNTPASAQPSEAGSASAAPKGYKSYTPQGFTAAVPAAWKMTSTGGEATFTGPKDSGLKISVVQVSAQKDGGLSELGREEADGGVAGYIQVHLQEVQYRGWKAADWEYTYTVEDGELPMHSQVRYVTIDGSTAFKITFSTPELTWDDQAETRKVFLDTFHPNT